MVDDNPDPDHGGQIPAAVLDHGVGKVHAGEDQDGQSHEEAEERHTDGDHSPGLGGVQALDLELVALLEGGLVGVSARGTLVREAVGKDVAPLVGKVPARVAAVLKIRVRIEKGLIYLNMDFRVGHVHMRYLQHTTVTVFLALIYVLKKSK